MKYLFQRKQVQKQMRMIVLEFPKERYPETGKHITDAIKEGHSEVCTIDRGGAADRRKLSLAPYPSKRV